MSEVAEASLADAMSTVPLSYEPQKKADFKHINEVYKKFWSECEDAYIFGVDAKRELSIDQLVDAPVEYNIQSREDKLVDAMVIYLLNLPERKARQTLCVMPTNRTEKPTSWEEIKDGDFYIINGQYSVAASRLITQVEQTTTSRTTSTCGAASSCGPATRRSCGPYPHTTTGSITSR